MGIYNVTLLALTILAGMLFYYLLLPKLNKSGAYANLFKALLFLGAVGFLAYDFYSKGKYSYLIVLAGGSIAVFVFLLRKKGE